MTTAENIQILYDAGYTDQAARMAQRESVAFVEEVDGSICEYEFADGSTWEPKTNTAKGKEMSKAQHTPGVLYVGAQNDGLYLVAGIKPAANNDYPVHDAERTCVAKIYEPAYANMLASAPELLEALEEGAACLKAQIDGSGGYAIEEVLDGMLEAIAKAKGE